MKNRPNHMLSAFVLWVYLFVGLGGHCRVLAAMLHLSISSSVIKQSKPFRSHPAGKVFWTQNKHVPSTPRAGLFSHAVMTDRLEPERDERSIVFPLLQPQVHGADCHPASSSRAPPILS